MSEIGHLSGNSDDPRVLKFALHCPLCCLCKTSRRRPATFANARRTKTSLASLEEGFLLYVNKYLIREQLQYLLERAKLKQILTR